MSQEVDDFLAHYGVKGMKWGKRKSRPSGTDIREARKRQASRERKFQEEEDNAILAKTDKDSKAAEKRAKEFAKEYDSSPDRAVAVRMTRGEQAVSVILFGPLAVVPIAATELTSRHYQKKNG